MPAGKMTRNRSRRKNIPQPFMMNCDAVIIDQLINNVVHYRIQSESNNVQESGEAE